MMFFFLQNIYVSTFEDNFVPCIFQARSIFTYHFQRWMSLRVKWFFSNFNHNFLLLQKILHIYLINTLLTQETFYKYFSQDLESPCKEETSHESPRSQFSWVSSIDLSTAAHSGASSLAKYFRVESHILVSIYTYTIPGILVIDCRWQILPYESQNKPKRSTPRQKQVGFKNLI